MALVNGLGIGCFTKTERLATGPVNVQRLGTELVRLPGRYLLLSYSTISRVLQVYEFLASSNTPNQEKCNER